MTVAELIAVLQKLPPEMPVQAVNADCCGCGAEPHVSLNLELTPGAVVIEAHYSSELPPTGPGDPNG